VLIEFVTYTRIIVINGYVEQTSYFNIISLTFKVKIGWEIENIRYTNDKM